MILFTTHQCSRCREIHEVFILESLGIKEIILTGENAEALAELAWYGLVEQARQSLPILVCDDNKVVTDIKEIAEILSDRAKSILIERLTKTSSDAQNQTSEPKGMDYKPNLSYQEGEMDCKDGTCSLQI